MPQGCSISNINVLGLVAQAYKSSYYLHARAGGQGMPGFQSEFKSILDNLVSLSHFFFQGWGFCTVSIAFG